MEIFKIDSEESLYIAQILTSNFLKLLLANFGFASIKSLITETIFVTGFICVRRIAGPRWPSGLTHYLQLKLLSGKNVRAWDSMDFT